MVCYAMVWYVSLILRKCMKLNCPEGWGKGVLAKILYVGEV